MIDTWLETHMKEISVMQDFTLAYIPEEPGDMAIALSMAQSYFSRCGTLLADAESFVLKAHAAAIIEAREKYQNFSAKEREILAKADETYLKVVRLRDNLSVIVQALKAKGFAIMNHRNTTGTRSMSTES